MAAKTYRTVQGDAWDSIAYKLWGKEHFMHYLMAANPAHLDILVFTAGIKLSVPALPVSSTTTEGLPPWMQ